MTAKIRANEACNDINPEEGQDETGWDLFTQSHILWKWSPKSTMDVGLPSNKDNYV